MKNKSKKTNNKNVIKILTIVLAIVLISMIGFFGIYKQNKNQMSNIVKGYSYAMDIKGARTIKLQLNTETKEVIKDSEGNEIEEATDEEIEQNGYIKEQVPNNSEEVKTEENYNKSKKIIEKRLKSLGVQEYKISLNTKTGEMIIEIPENSSTDTVVSNLNTIGKFEIIDSETKEVLLDNNNIKSSDVLYSTSTNGTSVFLEIAFNKEGKNKLEEISKTYVVTEDTNTAEETNTTSENNEIEENTTIDTTNTEVEVSTETEEEKTEKQITMKIDNEEIMTTSFDEPITTGKIQLSVGTATTDTATLQDYIAQAQNIATVLDGGNLPIQYDLEKNQYILSNISEEQLEYIALAVLVLIIIGLIILVIKYKNKGLLCAISYVGLVALYLILIRYANVLISIESIFGIIAVLILNYILSILLLSNIEKVSKDSKENVVNKSIIETYKKFYNRIIPICIMVIAFCFVKWIPISSFGMISFWGLLIIAIYNAVITRLLLKLKVESK